MFPVKIWIRNTFTTKSEMELFDSDTEPVTELSCNTTLKDIFNNMALVNLRRSCRQKYPFLVQKTIKFLKYFVTYKRETLIYSKINKYRDRLDAKLDFRIKFSSFSTDL